MTMQTAQVGQKTAKAVT